MSRKDKPAATNSKKKAVEYLPPLNPRRRLFYVLAGAFVLWVIVLLTLYFTTVYPMRHPREQGSQSAAVISADFIL
jgi:hypothetical protein